MTRWWLMAGLLLAMGCKSAAGEQSHDPSASDEPDTVRPEPEPPKPCKPSCASIERCEAGRCVPSCPPDEVYVPATGPEGFTMGDGKLWDDDRAHRVVLTRPFCMDATEVTVAHYRRCVVAGKCAEPRLGDLGSNYRYGTERDDHPVNMVSWTKAKAYCEHLGKALPSEAQWEWAAGHRDDRRFPWGDREPSCDNGLADFTPGGAPKSDPAGDVGCHGGGSSEVGAHPGGNSRWPDGELLDLGGNVWEWTADCFLPYPVEPQTDPSPQRHPMFREGCYVRSLRGGGWNRSMYALQVDWRGAAVRTYAVPGLGFRCVRNPG